MKHQLAEVKARFNAEEYIHVGDTDMDRDVSQEAGFHFIPVHDAGRYLQEMRSAP